MRVEMIGAGLVAVKPAGGPVWRRVGSGVGVERIREGAMIGHRQEVRRGELYRY